MAKKNKKEILLALLNEPKEQDTFTITIVNQGMLHPERITWNGDDNPYKAAYIDMSYDDDLVHMHNSSIQIVGWDRY